MAPFFSSNLEHLLIDSSRFKLIYSIALHDACMFLSMP